MRAWQAEDIGLFLVLMILTNGLILPVFAGTPPLSYALVIGAFYLAVFIHVPFTLFVGTFGRLRTVTWLVLIAAWAAAPLIALAGPLVPWTRDPDLRVAAVARWPLVALALLLLDLVAAHGARWRQRSPGQLAIFLAAMIAAAIAASVIAGALVVSVFLPGTAGGVDRPYGILPDWYVLPAYALLRAVPDKAAGLALAGAALVVPMIWPWMRADALRGGRTRWVWRALCVLLFASWIGFGWLGAQPPEEPAITVSRILAVFYFGYFLLAPGILRRIGGAVQSASRGS